MIVSYDLSLNLTLLWQEAYPPNSTAFQQHKACASPLTENLAAHHLTSDPQNRAAFVLNSNVAMNSMDLSSLIQVRKHRELARFPSGPAFDSVPASRERTRSAQTSETGDRKAVSSFDHFRTITLGIQMSDLSRKGHAGGAKYQKNSFLLCALREITILPALATGSLRKQCVLRRRQVAAVDQNNCRRQHES